MNAETPLADDRFNRMLADGAEPLCDELRECLVSVGDFTILRHPLVVELIPIGGLCNRILREKRELLNHPRYSRPSRRIWLYERPFRLDTACRWIALADAIDEDFRETLAGVWMDMESDDSDPELVRMCVAAFRKAGFITQDAAEIATPADGAALTLYRGGGSPRGMAWSTRLSVAEMFVKRAELAGESGDIWRARCAPEGVLAYLTARREYEVVCDPAFIRDARRVK